MIDIHAHLCFDDFEGVREKVAAECAREMKAVIVGTARHDEAVCALGLCARHGNLFPTLGYHPVEGGPGPERIMELAGKNADRIVGIGEVGLDYHWEKNAAKRKLQKAVFSKFIELAEGLGKPLVIHSWDAEEDCFKMVKDAGIPVIFHCYSGSGELAQRILGKGFFISFSTQVLFSKAHRKLAKAVPLSQMTLETDAPFLSPYNYLRAKGREGLLKEGFDPNANYPWNVRFSAEKIAEIKKVAVSEVLERTTSNAVKVFGLEV
jgi:TatD DNase family protein